MGKTLYIKAPCKINLHLHVKGRLSGGYHDLESVFLALDFGDTLGFSMGGGSSGEFRCEIRWDGLPAPSAASLGPEDNIVHKTAALFRARTGFDRPLRVSIDKRVPLGGGLGGGSSDAAAALSALNRLAGRPLSGAALEEMAGELGSDVPFFLTLAEGNSPGAALNPDAGEPGAAETAAFVTGRGERIRPVPAPAGIWALLVNPGFGSGTAGAFRLLDLWRDAEKTAPAGAGPSREALIGALGENPAGWPYANDFLPVFLAAGTEQAREAYSAIIHELKALGADFAGLSGTGSTCFGIFTGRKQAAAAENRLSGTWPFVRLTFPLARSANAVLQ
jgi:4-diphosphocytidyl-2-C-methyl-D-erythritol kinase